MIQYKFISNLSGCSSKNLLLSCSDFAIILVVLKGSCFQMSYLAGCIVPPFDIIVAKNCPVSRGEVIFTSSAKKQSKGATKPHKTVVSWKKRALLNAYNIHRNRD